jgi:signal transduction histidine kinase
VGKAFLTEPSAGLITCGAIYLGALLAAPALASRRPLKRALLILAFGAGTVCNLLSHNGTLLLGIPLIPLVAALDSFTLAIFMSAATLVTTVLSDIAMRQSLVGTIQNGVSYLGGAAFMVVFAQVMAGERRAVEERARMTKELAVERERKRVVQAIHDGVGHYLTAAVVQLEASRVVQQAANDNATQCFARARTLLQKAMGEVRQAATAMANPLAERSFQTAVAELIATNVEAGMTTPLLVEGTARPLPPLVEFAVFRGLQEALTNARRHSGASRVEVRLMYEAQCIRLRVADNGRGAERVDERMGLAGIRERVNQLGGDIAIEATQGRGLILSLQVPA